MTRSMRLWIHTLVLTLVPALFGAASAAPAAVPPPMALGIRCQLAPDAWDLFGTLPQKGLIESRSLSSGSAGSIDAALDRLAKAEPVDLEVPGASGSPQAPPAAVSGKATVGSSPMIVLLPPQEERPVELQESSPTPRFSFALPQLRELPGLPGVEVPWPLPAGDATTLLTASDEPAARGQSRPLYEPAAETDEPTGATAGRERVEAQFAAANLPIDCWVDEWLWQLGEALDTHGAIGRWTDADRAGRRLGRLAAEQWQNGITQGAKLLPHAGRWVARPAAAPLPPALAAPQPDAPAGASEPVELRVAQSLHTAASSLEQAARFLRSWGDELNRVARHSAAESTMTR